MAASSARLTTFDASFSVVSACSLDPRPAAGLGDRVGEALSPTPPHAPALGPGALLEELDHPPPLGHVRSWVGFCHARYESAGKRLPTRTRPAGDSLAQDDARAGRLGAVRRRDTYLYAQCVRLKSRRGPRKAILAVAASMLTAAY